MLRIFVVAGGGYGGGGGGYGGGRGGYGECSVWQPIRTGLVCLLGGQELLWLHPCMPRQAVRQALTDARLGSSGPGTLPRAWQLVPALWRSQAACCPFRCGP